MKRKIVVPIENGAKLESHLRVGVANITVSLFMVLGVHQPQAEADGQCEPANADAYTQCVNGGSMAGALGAGAGAAGGTVSNGSSNGGSNSAGVAGMSSGLNAGYALNCLMAIRTCNTTCDQEAQEHQEKGNQYLQSPPTVPQAGPEFQKAQLATGQSTQCTMLTALAQSALGQAQGLQGAKGKDGDSAQQMAAQDPKKKQEDQQKQQDNQGQGGNQAQPQQQATNDPCAINKESAQCQCMHPLANQSADQKQTCANLQTEAQQLATDAQKLANDLAAPLSATTGNATAVRAPASAVTPLVQTNVGLDSGADAGGVNNSKAGLSGGNGELVKVVNDDKGKPAPVDSDVSAAKNGTSIGSSSGAAGNSGAPNSGAPQGTGIGKINIGKYLAKRKRGVSSEAAKSMDDLAADGVTSSMGPSLWEKVSSQYQHQMRQRDLSQDI